jgi:hypothetical protein
LFSGLSALGDPRGKNSMDALAWKNVLELAAGNPVIVGYLSYVVGLLIAIAIPELCKAQSAVRR